MEGSGLLLEGSQWAAEQPPGWRWAYKQQSSPLNSNHYNISTSNMSTKKILVVFGATGTQGGSVIDSILGDPKASQEFQLRGITRDPSKPNAKALAARGVECVTVLHRARTCR